MTEDFDPDQYHDAYREALEAVVQAKVEGNDVVRPAGVEAPSPKGQPADLTEILRASVAALKAGRADSDAPKSDDAKPKSRTRAKAAAKDDTKEEPAAKPRTRRKASA